jgi:ATP/maltotriose-dependent transcriptional regulator MalT
MRDMSTPARDAATDADALLDAGRRALRAGEWQRGRDLLSAALAIDERPEALEGMAQAARHLGLEEEAFRSSERAFAIYRARGDRHGAARVALVIGEDSAEWRGEIVVAHGWLRRARRLIENDRESPEYIRVVQIEGYLALMEHNDTETTIRRARESADLARQIGLVGAEMLAIGLEGLALVSAGAVAEGMARLDEAAAAAVAGEIDEPEARGTACCMVIDACSRVRDFDRAAQWCHQLERIVGEVHIGPFLSVCRPNYAQVLIWRGHWQQAESELRRAATELEAWRAPMAAESLIRLAELRCRQGRYDEAAALFERVGPLPLAQLGQAQLALAMGDAAHARSFVDRYLRRMPADARAERAAGLELLVPALILAGQVERAAGVADELAVLAAGLGTRPFLAAALFARGSVELARGRLAEARQHFEDACDLFAALGGTFDCARARLELAHVLVAAGEHGDGLREAAAARSVLAGIGATPLVLRASFLLGEREGEGSGAPAGLTRREAEVLALMARGLSNAEIADGLVLSIRTVERHISNIYDKLGVNGPGARVAAAAYASAHGLRAT